MKKKLVVCWLLLAFTGIGYGSQPGQLAADGAGQVLTSPPSVQVLHMTESLPGEGAGSRHDRIMNRVWVASLLAAAAATAMDATTSWGKREGNGLLASPDGTFAGRGLSIKIGMFAALAAPQLIFRRHKELKTKFVIGNFVEAGIFTGVAIHNTGVSAPR